MLPSPELILFIIHLYTLNESDGTLTLYALFNDETLDTNTLYQGQDELHTKKEGMTNKANNFSTIKIKIYNKKIIFLCSRSFKLKFCKFWRLRPGIYAFFKVLCVISSLYLFKRKYFIVSFHSFCKSEISFLKYSSKNQKLLKLLSKHKN